MTSGQCWRVKQSTGFARTDSTEDALCSEQLGFAQIERKSVGTFPASHLRQASAGDQIAPIRSRTVNHCTKCWRNSSSLNGMPRPQTKTIRPSPDPPLAFPDVRKSVYGRVQSGAVTAEDDIFIRQKPRCSPVHHLLEDRPRTPGTALIVSAIAPAAMLARAMLMLPPELVRIYSNGCQRSFPSKN